MIQLVTLIAEQVRDRKDIFDREGAIMQILLNSGYPLQEVNAALTVVQKLVQERADGLIPTTEETPVARVMGRGERSRFTLEAFGFVTRLARLGIISDDHREDLLEKAMVVYAGRIELYQIKTLVALVLFTGEYDEGNAESQPALAADGTMWN